MQISRRAGVSLLLLAAGCGAFAQQYQLIVFPDYVNGNTPLDAFGSQVVGESSTSSPSDALLWDATTFQASLLTPSGAGDAVASTTNGTQQAGWYFPSGAANEHAILWNGSATNFVDLHPSGWGGSFVFGMDAQTQGGYVTKFDPSTFTSTSHAFLWQGTAASGVDLDPGDGTLPKSYLLSVGGGQQAGFLSDTYMTTTHAYLWFGSASGGVDLHPSVFASSQANYTDGAEQVGSATTDTFESHAYLWTGSSASGVDLTPAGFTGVAQGCLNGVQVGYVDNGNGSMAALWKGTAASYFDLSQFVPSTYLASFAVRVLANGTIMGGVVDGVGTHVALWVPVNTPPVANPGTNQTVEATGPQTNVTLDGSGSSDADGDSLTYSWALGSTVVGTTAKVTVPLNLGSYTFSLTVTDTAGLTNSANVNVTVQDTTPPTITIKGGNPLSYECAPTFIDPGATAYDLVDGNCPITPSGTVNSLLPGTYTVTYSSSDQSGNTATATRTVNVVDNDPPKITLNGVTPMQVALNTTFSDPGATATDDCPYNLQVNETGSVDTTKVGTYVLTYTATDYSGNQASVQRTVNVVAPSTGLSITGVSADPSSVSNDKKMHKVHVLYTVTGGDGRVECHLTVKVDDGDDDKDHHDWHVLDAHHVEVRGKLGEHHHRTYVITIHARDHSKHHAEATVSVQVSQ